MSSVIWYLYEFARKGWIENFAGAATNTEIVETPDRFRDFPEVIRELCIACGACTAACPSPAAIRLVRTKDKDAENGEGITYPVINTDACIRCGFCAEVCPTDPKTLDPYATTTYSTGAYTICADLEEDGTGDSDSDENTCDQSVANLQ